MTPTPAMRRYLRLVMDVTDRPAIPSRPGLAIGVDKNHAMRAKAEGWAEIVPQGRMRRVVITPAGRDAITT